MKSLLVVLPAAALLLGAQAQAQAAKPSSPDRRGVVRDHRGIYDIPGVGTKVTRFCRKKTEYGHCRNN
jgi:hypothetical protein